MWQDHLAITLGRGLRKARPKAAAVLRDIDWNRRHLSRMSFIDDVPDQLNQVIMFFFGRLTPSAFGPPQ